jgi:hypothetical protein
MLNRKPKKTPIKGEPVNQVKIKEEPSCSLCNKKRPLVNKTKKICHVCAKKIAAEKLKAKKEKVRKKKAESISVLTKKLDRVFSQYIRIKYANEYGIVKCFTCNNEHHWKEIQNGHFQSRRYMSIRFHENNCRPQCYACNVGLHGNQYVFGVNLDREIGSGKAEEMVMMSKVTKKFSSLELQEMIDIYTKNLEQVKFSKNIVD